MPTALELGPSGWGPYLQAARARPARPPLTPDERAERRRLLRRARQAASLLKDKFGARRVVLFGSLSHGAWFTARTDVDLAVEGLAPRAYWRAWDEVERLVGDRMVHLVDMDDASPSLRSAIERIGVEL
jgi:predicted nucleotidyltransferase